MVKIEDDDDSQNRLKSVSGNMKESSHKLMKPRYNNGDLPPGALAGNLWRRTVIPTFLHFVASLRDPWTFADDNATHALQLIWDHIYTSQVQHDIASNGAVFSVVSKHLLYCYKAKAFLGESEGF